MKNKCYSELITIPTFKERFEYLKLDSTIGEETFGYDRYMNQRFYTSEIWKRFRRDIIIRDFGHDLGMEEDLYEITGIILVHHIIPITIEDIRYNRIEKILDPENVICSAHKTHNAIHFGDFSLIDNTVIERRPNDTCPWRK